MKKLLIIIVTISTILTANAQSYISYSYDAAGNRTARQTVILKNKQDTTEYNKAARVKTQFAEGDITVYPNPADEQLNIKFTNIDIKEKIKLNLYDMNGRLVKSQQTKNTQTNMYIGDKPPEAYILKITSANSKAEFTVIKK